MKKSKDWQMATPRDAYALAYSRSRKEADGLSTLDHLIHAETLFERLGLTVIGDTTPLHNAARSRAMRDAQDYYALPADSWERKARRHHLYWKARGRDSYLFAA